jgi:ribose/xylose/arabinose/galactoside ABC-type transport system permease subunit
VVAGAGKKTSAQSMSVLLPIGALGSILMPLLIGLIADRVSLRAGMSSILVTLGLMLFFPSFGFVKNGRPGRCPGPPLKGQRPLRIPFLCTRPSVRVCGEGETWGLPKRDFRCTRPNGILKGHLALKRGPGAAPLA